MNNNKYIVIKPFVDKSGNLLKPGCVLFKTMFFSGQSNGWEFLNLINQRHVISTSDARCKMLKESEYLKKKLDIILGQS